MSAAGSLDIVDEDVPVMYVYGEVRTCLAASPAISEEMSTMLPAALEGAAMAGVVASGRTVSVYFSWDPANHGTTTFTTGLHVAGDSPTPVGNGLGVRAVLGCRCATAIHVGPFETLRSTHDAIAEWASANGYERRMPWVEIYENDPRGIDPTPLRTRIYVPIALERQWNARSGR